MAAKTKKNTQAHAAKVAGKKKKNESPAKGQKKSLVSANAAKASTAAPFISNEQRIKSALKKLAGNAKNTPTVFKLPSRRSTPVAFSLNEVRDLIKEKSKKGNAPADNLQVNAPSVKRVSPPDVKPDVDQKPRVLKSATLDDLLGGRKKAGPAHYDESKVPAKWMPYFKKLTALRDRLTLSVEERSEQTLKTSVKESAGDLSSYDMADAGTDTFDYDYSLSLVSSEQEMLREIDSAIDRIFDGTYGICEVTGKPINRDRLNAVPFTRFSKEGQDQYEKTKRRSTQRVGITSGEEDVEDGLAAAGDEGADSSE